jgi:hypothetical protein
MFIDMITVTVVQSSGDKGVLFSQINISVVFTYAFKIQIIHKHVNVDYNPLKDMLVLISSLKKIEHVEVKSVIVIKIMRKNKLYCYFFSCKK